MPSADDCCAWAREIGESLLDVETVDGSFANGDAGLALFFAYLAQHTSDQRHSDQAETRLGAAIARAGDMNMFLFSGSVGVAWVTEHVCGALLAPNEEDVNVETDDFVASYLVNPEQWAQRWELMYGIVGYGVYLLERPKSPRRDELLARVIATLDRVAEHDADSGVIRWASNTDPTFKERVQNLGLAHGVSGVIAFLAQMVSENVERASVERLLRGTIAELQRHRRDQGESRYPSFVHLGDVARLAWCYGDLAIATALVPAGQALSEPSWIEEGRDLAVHATTRTEQQSHVIEIGLCHGAMGLAYMFDRVNVALEEPMIAAASARWLARSFEMRAPDRGLAGIQAYKQPSREWVDDPGLLGGAAGVGLALLTLGGASSPRWARSFLLR